MSAVPVAPVEPDAKSLEVDAVEHMAVVLVRVIEWLAQTNNIDTVRETKAVVVGYEALIREKKLALDAQLSASECVRRCERRIGELVKQGLEEGTIRSKRDSRPRPMVPAGTIDDRPRASDYIPGGAKGYAEYRVMASAADEQFEQAVEEARAEGNLSRANVVRKIKGEGQPTPKRSEVHHQQRLESPGPSRIVVEFRRLDDSMLGGVRVENGPEGLVAVTVAAQDPGP